MDKTTFVVIFILGALWLLYVTLVIDPKREQQYAWIKENCVFVEDNNGYVKPICPEELYEAKQK